MADAVLAVLILLPLVLTILLRSNGGLMFLALSAGYLVQTLTGGDLQNVLNDLNLKGVRGLHVYLLLLVVPVLLVILLTIHNWAGRTRMVTQGAAALVTGGVLALLSAPLLNGIYNLNLDKSVIWSGIHHIQSFLVGFGALYCLLLVLLSQKKHKDKKHK